MGEPLRDDNSSRRPNERLNFLSPVERRKHRRVGSSVFGRIPLLLRPAAPFEGGAFKGKIVDLSVGGLAVQVDEMVLPETKMKLAVAFPGQEPVVCEGTVRRAVPGQRGFIIGLKFDKIPNDLLTEFVRISNDYDACEDRIQIQQPLCSSACAFYNYCEKPEKSVPPPAAAAPPSAVAEKDEWNDMWDPKKAPRPRFPWE